MPGGDDFYDIIDESIIESLIIIGLAATLAFLVYYRQQRQTNHQRQQVAAQQAQGQGGVLGVAPVDGQQADGGFFPPEADPGFGQWVAGGVGH